jgi:hypothetical protein
MGQVRVLTDAFGYIVVITFWVTFAFPVVVATFWKWWQTQFGNSYVWKTILLCGATAPSALHKMFGLDIRSPAFLWFVVIDFGMMSPVVIWRGIVLWSEQRKGRSLNPVIAVRDWFRLQRAARRVQRQDQEPDPEREPI